MFIVATINLALFTPDTKLNTFTFNLATLFGTQTRVYEPLIILQLPPNLLKLTKKKKKEFLLTGVGLA